jgi:hypothetical protein
MTYARERHEPYYKIEFLPSCTEITVMFRYGRWNNKTYNPNLKITPCGYDEAVKSILKFCKSLNNSGFDVDDSEIIKEIRYCPITMRIYKLAHDHEFIPVTRRKRITKSEQAFFATILGASKLKGLINA